MNIATKSTFVLNRRHLLGIEGLSPDEIIGLLDLAEEFVELNRQIEEARVAARAHAHQPVLRGFHPHRSPRSSLPASASAPTS